MRLIGRQRLSEAYQKLKNAILNGDWKPGERLGEEVLAKELAISRNTLRLVMSRLEEDGIVESEPFKGKRVAKLSLDQAREILEARQILESATIRLAAVKITEEALQELSKVITRMREANRVGDYDQYSRLNTEFHHGIAQAADNSVVAQILLDLKTRLVRVQYRTALVPGRTDQSLVEHIGIFDALRKHDADQADAAMRVHVRHVWETIRDHHKLLDIGGTDYAERTP